MKPSPYNRSNYFISTLLLVVLFFCYSLDTHAQNYESLIKSLADDFQASDNFGYSVGIDGDYAVVGARNEDHNASGTKTSTTSNHGYAEDAGAVYILKRDKGGTDNWGILKKIIPDDRQEDDYFGTSVSIAGDYIIVGASGEDHDATGTSSSTTSSNGYASGAGAAYVFKKDQGGSDNWGQIKKLVSNDRQASDLFGSFVDISGDYIVVGAPGEAHDLTGTSSSTTGNGFTVLAGSAYVFKKDQGGTDNWGQIKKLIADDRQATDFFGWDASIDGNHIAIGAKNEDHDETGTSSSTTSSNGYAVNAGAAYVFQKDNGGTDNWGQIAKVVANDRQSGDQFGSALDISGENLAVGSPYEDHDTTGTSSSTTSSHGYLADAGSGYIFKQNQGGSDNWGQIRKLWNGRTAGDYIGTSISISGKNLAVGATGALTGSGEVSIFRQDLQGLDVWFPYDGVEAFDGLSGDGFAGAIAINTDGLILNGSQNQDYDTDGVSSSATDAGAVYFHQFECKSNDSIATITDSTITSAYATTDVNGWTHFCSNEDALLLSLYIGSSGAVIEGDEVQLKIGSSTTYSYTGADGGMIATNDKGYVMIDRRWDVSPTTQPSTGNVGVRFYFSEDEYDDLVVDLQSHGPSSSYQSKVDSVQQLNIFKATSGASFADPHTVSGIILPNTTGNPSTTQWTDSINAGFYSYHIAEFEVSSFSGGGVGGGGGGGGGHAPLPVDFIDFKVQKQGDKSALLIWSTASEINNDHFVIERSFDGLNFEGIGQVAGQGNSNMTSDYSFRDEFNLIPTVVYYRLKQVDFDDRTSLSPVRKLDFTHSSILFYPNPASAQLTFDLTNTEDEFTEISIVDQTGRTRFKQILISNEIHAIDIHQIESGIYTIQIEGDLISHRARLVVVK